MMLSPLFLFGVVVSSVLADLLPISVNPDRQRLVDSFGREVFFHGTNVVVKEFHGILNSKAFRMKHSLSKTCRNF